MKVYKTTKKTDKKQAKIFNSFNEDPSASVCEWVKSVGVDGVGNVVFFGTDDASGRAINFAVAVPQDKLLAALSLLKDYGLMTGSVTDYD